MNVHQIFPLQIFLLVLFTYTCPLHGNNTPARTNPPNVIIIITDDQGYGDLGCHGNKILQTPHLDHFFGEATEASNFHVSPTCSPTRGAIMTGRYTNRVGTWHTIAGRSLLFEDETILPQIFARNGYATGMFGKWHLGDNYPLRAKDRGFQEVVRHGGGGITQGPDWWGNDYFDDTYWHNGQPQEYPGYCTDVFFEESLHFIEENQSQPFFLYLATNAAHGPFHVPESYYDQYREHDIPEAQKRFFGMITNIDDNFKRLEDKLRQLGLRENTIVIFMTDNGSAAGIIEKEGKIFGHDAGLRGKKGSQYEGGHRVPFAIRWPAGQISGGKKLDQLLAHIDLLPTLVDLARLKFNDLKPLDGRSFAPLLANPEGNWESRSLITDSQRMRNLIKWRNSAVMLDEWRLIDGKELYNLDQDLDQSDDVAEDYPQIVNRLRLVYENWWSSLKHEKVNERYAYIKVGTAFENPSRISAHDILIYPQSGAWHQNGALNAAPGQGILKIEVAAEGSYKISLRRFPRESGLAFNATVPAREGSVGISNPMPAAQSINLTEAILYMGEMGGRKLIEGDVEEVSFTGYLAAGKYDMTAVLKDATGRVYPAYYTYIEKL